MPYSLKRHINPKTKINRKRDDKLRNHVITRKQHRGIHPQKPFGMKLSKKVFILHPKNPSIQLFHDPNT